MSMLFTCCCYLYILVIFVPFLVITHVIIVLQLFICQCFLRAPAIYMFILFACSCYFHYYIIYMFILFTRFYYLYAPIIYMPMLLSCSCYVCVRVIFTLLPLCSHTTVLVLTGQKLSWQLTSNWKLTMRGFRSWRPVMHNPTRVPWGAQCQHGRLLPCIP